MTPPRAPQSWRAAWPILRAQVRPFHAWICLAGFVLAMIATGIVAPALVASIILHPEGWAGRLHEPVLIILLLIAIDLFWFTVWRIYRRIAAENRARRDHG